jgi:hypothetical protein
LRLQYQEYCITTHISRSTIPDFEAVLFEKIHGFFRIAAGIRLKLLMKMSHNTAAAAEIALFKRKKNFH